ncbi:MAG: YtxH domain-containing protein [Bacteroidales bacterium]|nr:YtxH domain-containing protein [Candidatus Cryptobacteroides equifaecalis]
MKGNTVLGFLAGAAVGAAVAALIMSGKGREIVAEASDAISDGLDKLESSLKESLEDGE